MSPVTPQQVVSLLLYAPATALVPKTGLPPSEVQFLDQWSPGAVASTVPAAAVQALTPQAIAQQLTPTALAQNMVQTLAAAAVIAAFA